MIVGIQQAVGWGTGETADIRSLGLKFSREEWALDEVEEADDLFARGAAAGIGILPLLNVPDDPSSALISSLDRTAYATWCANFVTRFGPGGDFWTENTRYDPSLAPTVIELVNEPWGDWYFRTVEPAAYLALYRAMRNAGNAVNPDVKFLLACTRTYGSTDWVAALAAADPNMASYVDAAYVHPYTGDSFTRAPTSRRGSSSEYGGQILDVMANLATADVDVPVWVTEMGFRGAVLGDDTQAEYLTTALELAEEWGVQGFSIYGYKDGADPDADEFGIVTRAGVHKAAATAVAEFIADDDTEDIVAVGSRSFDGSGDEIQLRLGSAGLTAGFTIAVLIRTPSTANQVWFEELGTNDGYQFGVDAGQMYLYAGRVDGRSSTAPTLLPPATTECIVFVGKAAGGAVPRFSVLNLETGSITHENGDTSVGNTTAATGYRLGRYTGGGYDYAGLMGLAAAWNSNLADATRAGLTTLTSLLAASPVLLVDERDGFTVDRTGNGADQSSITGTTHSTDEPTGFWPAATSIGKLLTLVI